MDGNLMWRVLALCVLLASAETLHGIARTVWVVSRLGKERALKWSAVSGSMLATVLCAFFVPPMGLHSTGELLALGAVLSLFMASFDLALGHWLLRRPWRKALEDLNPRQGNYLLYGLIWLALAPLLVSRISG